MGHYTDDYAEFVEYVAGMQKTMELHAEHLLRSRQIEELAAGMGGSPTLIKRILEAERINKEYVGYVKSVRNIYTDTVDKIKQTDERNYDPRTMVTEEDLSNAYADIEALFERLADLMKKYKDANRMVLEANRPPRRERIKVEQEPEKSRIRELQKQLRKIERDIDAHQEREFGRR